MLRSCLLRVLLAAVALASLAMGRLADAQRVRIPERVAANTNDPPSNSKPPNDGWVAVKNKAPATETTTKPVSASQTELASPVMTFDPYETVGNPQTLLGPTYGAAPPSGNWNCQPPLRFRIYGEGLYLQPGAAASTSVAMPVSAAVIPPPNPSVALGPVLRLDPVYDPGFRVGFGFRPGQKSEFGVSYTYFHSQTDVAQSLAPQNAVALRALVMHPRTFAANSLFLDATAGSSLTIQLGDVDYRYFFLDSGYRLNMVLGGRYAHLQQDFNATFSNLISVETVRTDIDFTGGGLRLGLEGEWRSQNTGFLVYANGYSSFVTGQFRGSYVQQDNFAGVVVNTSYSDDRIVPILELELGVGWSGQQDRVRLSAGYTFNAWYNVVSNRELINAVQTAQFEDIQDTLTLDGLVVRAEFRF